MASVREVTGGSDSGQGVHLAATWRKREKSILGRGEGRNRSISPKREGVASHTTGGKGDGRGSEK